MLVLSLFTLDGMHSCALFPVALVSSGRAIGGLDGSCRLTNLVYIGYVMGARSHGQEGALATSLSGNVVKCFCALVVTAKRSVDELLMHYFHRLSLASEGFTPRPHQGSIPGLPWGLSSPDQLFAHPW